MLRCLFVGAGKKQLGMSMESGIATATVDLDKLIIDFSTWEEVHLTTY